MNKEEITKDLTPETAEKPDAVSLLPEELEVKIQSYSDQSFTVVVYWNARVAMAKLSQKYGDEWSKTIKMMEKKSADTPFYAICSVKVTGHDGEVIVREDVGQDDDSPKSAATDAFKRAAMNFIPAAQALYTLPPLRIYVSKLGINVNGKDAVKKEVRFKHFYVNSVSFAKGASGIFVKAIQIADEETGEIVHEYNSKRTAITRSESERMLELRKQMLLATVTEDEILNRYKKAFRVSSLEEIADTDNLFESATRWLEGRAKKNSSGATAASSVNEQLKGSTKKTAGKEKTE